MLCLNGNESTCVAASLEQNLHDWVQVGLHAPLEVLKHVTDGDQCDLGEGRAQGVRQLAQLLNQRVQGRTMLQDQVLVELDYAADLIASLKLHVPVSTRDQVLESQFEYFLRLFVDPSQFICCQIVLI